VRIAVLRLGVEARESVTGGVTVASRWTWWRKCCGGFWMGVPGGSQESTGDGSCSEVVVIGW